MNLFLVGMLLMTVMYAAAQPPVDLPQLSIVARPANLQPGQPVALTVSVHAADGPRAVEVLVGAAPVLHLDRVTARGGTCTPNGIRWPGVVEWRCVVAVAPDAPTMIDVAAHLDPMPCARQVRIYAASGGWLGDAEWLTILDPHCRVYLPLASQEG